MPVFFVKSWSVGVRWCCFAHCVSMYSSQFEKLRTSFSSSPPPPPLPPPPQAARSAGTTTRLHRRPPAAQALFSSEPGSCAVSFLLSLYDERLLRIPAERHLRPGRRNGHARVLREHLHRSGGRVDDDVRRNADVRGLGDRPLQDVVAAARPSAIFSGRTPAATFPPWPFVSALITVPSASRSAPGPSTAADRRFETPRKPATKAVAGRSYSSSGEPSCSIRPPFMTAIESAIVIASSWSCVTWMNVMPSCWMRLRNSCICLRSLRSSAPSGSSSRSTRGRQTSAREAQPVAAGLLTADPTCDGRCPRARRG